MLTYNYEQIRHEAVHNLNLAKAEKEDTLDLMLLYKMLKCSLVYMVQVCLIVMIS